MARCKCIASSLPVLVLLSLSATAQSDPISDQGIKPYENYHSGDIDVVSLGNGKLDLYGLAGEILTETDAAGNLQNEYVYFGWEGFSLVPESGSALYCAEEPFMDLDAHLCAHSANSCSTLTVDDPSTEGAGGQAKAQTPASQAPNKNNPKEVELEDVIFNETGGLRADPKAKPGAPGSAQNLHDARVAVAEIAERVLESSHPEREQAPHSLTHQTQRDLDGGNKDVIRALDDSLSAARSGSDTTHGAMHFRTGRHKFRSLYGGKATIYFGPFHDVTGGKRYLTIAP